MKKPRPSTVAICGGAFGDEGKGRVVDEYVTRFAQKGPVVVYRDNGGANAGHTIELPDGQRLAMHQLPSGIFEKKATVVLGKGMVLHPQDLLTEIRQVSETKQAGEIKQTGKTKQAGEIKQTGKTKVARILIDEMAVLSLDTHRALEAALKNWQTGSKGATGRGISPAYADVLLRHPVRMRDLKPFNKAKIREHYLLYEALLKGLGQKLSTARVPSLSSKKLHAVGSFNTFANRLAKQVKELSGMIANGHDFMKKAWRNKKYRFIFEKAQAVGLDHRWGVYPDVTASNTAIDGIEFSTEGLVRADDIEIKAGVIKATYMSSVGIRKLPTVMNKALVERIRHDAHEYGATTQRPRDVFHLDLPALRFYAQVGQINHLVLTHMDIVYPDQPVKVCVAYTIGSREVAYRPDQEFLLKVKPKYREFKPWDQAAVKKAKTMSELPANARKFAEFVARELGTEILVLTTGPQRNQSVWNVLH